jgi:hypothetical protein
MVMQRKNTFSFARIILLFLLVTGFGHLYAQNDNGLRFSEILVYNESNCIDNYGSHSPWIEIYNSSENQINIGGCYLTDDVNNPTKYWIPDGDQSTIIKPKSYLVFWADGKPERGILHLNFDLTNAKTIALVSATGNKKIDKIEIPQPQKPDVTYGRLNPESNELMVLANSTPGTMNDLSQKNTQINKSKNVDISGITSLAKFFAIAFVIIIAVIIVLKIRGRKNIETLDNSTTSEQNEPVTYQEVPEEVNAAIALALYLYENDLHDNENTVLTLQKVSRTYSPWSSKIYTLRKLPR